MKYRITEYVNKHGNTLFKLEKKILGCWWRIQRPLELAHGMTDPFTREEAERLMHQDAAPLETIIKIEEIEMG